MSGDAAFAGFLRMRAGALLSDDYYQSDLAWLDLKEPKFDVIFAPYETYLDDLLGVKTSYGASILIRNEEESRKLALYEKYVPDIQDALPLGAADRPSKRGRATPMEVMDAPYRAGDLRHGYQAVADNLPNDPRVHQEKGSKKIFFKNFMDARVTEIILPMAKKMMQPGQAEQVSAEGYLTGTVLHEIAHGRAEMMEFNYLLEQGALARADGRYVIDYARMSAALTQLSRELLETEATGDRARAEAWFARYDKMPAELKSALAATADIPVDIRPTFSFPDQ